MRKSLQDILEEVLDKADLYATEIDRRGDVVVCDTDGEELYDSVRKPEDARTKLHSATRACAAYLRFLIDVEGGKWDE